MSRADQDVEAGVVRLSAENVGGIDRTEVELPPGVNVLTGRNATNRTSLLRALMAALGSDDVSLKGDADEGRVELALDGETYVRHLERHEGTVTVEGEPYLEDSAPADLFAFLLETNEARRAVARGADLRELILEPVDTASIETQIDRLEAEKRDLDAEIDQLESLEGELPDLKRERARLRDEIEARREEVADLEAEIERQGADVERRREERSRLEETMAELREARGELEDVRYDIDAQERSLEALEEEREELAADRTDYPESVDDELAAIDAEIEQLRGRQGEIEAELNELGTVIQFNEDMLADGPGALAGAIGEDDDDPVTEQLVGEDTTVCWTCGTEVAADRIEGTLDRLRELRREKRDRKRSLQAEIDDLREEKIEYQEKRRQRDQIRDRLGEIEAEIERRERRLEQLRERREEQADRVERLQAEADEMEGEEHGELLELHREANELEFEIGRLENELDDVESEIEAVEEQLAELEDRKDRRAAVGEELAELRTRIREIESGAVEEFNEHMAALLDLLDYDNLERIWIERIAREGAAEADAFELHVVRSTAEGVTYEDTVDHLSESEREVTGLVFALAGYLVHDLAADVPFILLDSLEAIDSDRIASLVEYFADYAEYLVVALLPEDAAALGEDANYVSDI